MQPLEVSASIVVYQNGPREVLAAIESVLCSPLRVACTVVDNSPTAELRQAVEGAGATYIYAGRNLGFGAGHNLALRAESGRSEYHLALNPDVHFAPEVLGALYDFMNGNQGVGLVMPKILNEDGTEQGLCKRLPTPLDLVNRRFLGRLGDTLFASQRRDYELQHVDLGVTREIPCLSGCFMFLRSEVLREVGVFDERYFMYMEDVDLCRRIGAKYQTVFYPKVAITHGYTKGSYSSGTLLRYHMQSAIKYFAKWGWIFDATRRRLNKKTAPLTREQAARESAA